MEPDLAPPGTVWMCGACQRTNTDRNAAWDTSCRTWAVLVSLDSIQRDAQGRVTAATAVLGR